MDNRELSSCQMSRISPISHGSATIPQIPDDDLIIKQERGGSMRSESNTINPLDLSSSMSSQEDDTSTPIGAFFGRDFTQGNKSK